MSSEARTNGFLLAPVSRGNLRAQVTSQLVTGIFLGHFRPNERLVVQRVAEAFDVSPTPVREALVEIAYLGLVDMLPNRGAVVRPFGAREVREIGQLRRLLESEAARCAADRLPVEALMELQSELRRLERWPQPRDHAWDEGSRVADNRLHGLVAEWCGNARLDAEIGRYRVLYRALRDVCHLRDASTNYSRANDVPEHLEIVELLLAHDAEGAARAMGRHIESASRTMATVIFGQEAGGDGAAPAAEIGDRSALAHAPKRRAHRHD